MQIWWRRAKSPSVQAADIGWKKEEQSCPSYKRNELCVSMAIKMKDDKSSLRTLV